MQEGAHAPDVRPRVPRLAAALLGRAPGGAAGRACRTGQIGETDVEDLGPPSLGQQHAPRLEPAVGEAAGVRGGQGGGDLHRQIRGVLGIERAAKEAFRQGLPGAPAPGEEEPAAGLAHLLQRAQVGMDEPAGDARRARIGAVAAGEHAEADQPLVARVARAPDRILSVAQGVEELVMGEDTAVQGDLPRGTRRSGGASPRSLVLDISDCRPTIAEAHATIVAKPRSPRMVRTTLALLLLAALPAAAQKPAAQEPQSAQEGETFFESIDVQVVNLEVFVTDRKGQRVTGLTRDDFEVLEDGKPIELSNFFAVSAEQREVPPSEPAPEAAPAEAKEAAGEIPAEQRLHLAIVVDDLTLIPQNRNRLLQAVERDVLPRLRPDDFTMVAVIDGGAVRITQGLTTVPDQIRKALDDATRSALLGTARLMD